MAEPPAVPSFAFAKVEQNFLYFQINTRNITTSPLLTCTQLPDLPANYKQPNFFPKTTPQYHSSPPNTSKTIENREEDTETRARSTPNKGKQKDNATLEHTRQSIAPSPQQHLRGGAQQAKKRSTSLSKKMLISPKKDQHLLAKRSTSFFREINEGLRQGIANPPPQLLAPSAYS